MLLKKAKTLVDFWAPLQLTSDRKRKSCNNPWIVKPILTTITMKSKLYKRMIKIKNPFKNCELEDKVKGYKANLTKLIRINKAKHFNNYFLENKKNLLNTCDGIRGVININKKLSKDINACKSIKKPFLI